MSLTRRSAIGSLTLSGLTLFSARNDDARAAVSASRPSGAKPATSGLVIDRFKIGPNGETYWLKCRVPMSPWVSPRGTSGINMTVPIQSNNVQIWDMPAGLNSPPHPAPEQQFVVVLSGVLRVTLSHGVSKSFRSGDVFLATDKGTGDGHRTETVGGPVRVLLIPIGEDLDVDSWTVSGAAMT